MVVDLLSRRLIASDLLVTQDNFVDKSRDIARQSEARTQILRLPITLVQVFYDNQNLNAKMIIKRVYVFG